MVRRDALHKGRNGKEFNQRGVLRITRGKKRTLWWLVFAAAFFLSLIVTPVIVGGNATAHDWYPMECCSGMDCAPVEKVEMLPGSAIAGMLGTPANANQLGVMLVTTKHGSVVIPANFPRRESKDNRMHACMRCQVGHVGKDCPQRLICIFMPPAIFGCYWIVIGIEIDASFSGRPDGLSFLRMRIAAPL